MMSGGRLGFCVACPLCLIIPNCLSGKDQTFLLIRADLSSGSEVVDVPLHPNTKQQSFLKREKLGDYARTFPSLISGRPDSG